MLKEMMKEVWASRIGKIGLVMLAVLVGVSAYVTITFPKDFGKKTWGDPEYWGDNPKSAPPFWTTWFDKDKSRHYVFKFPNLFSREHIFRAKTKNGKTPAFLSFSLSKVTYRERPPVVEVYLDDKEGHEVLLHRLVVPGPREGEASPYVRYGESPYRINITSSPETKWRAERFFKDLEKSGEEEFSILIKTNLSVAGDGIGEVKAVVGGDTYGWFGTDNIGRDLFKGVLYGVPIALLIALPAAFLANLLGASAGGISGYAGGAVDMFIQRLIDIISNIPLLPILIFLVFIFGPHIIFIIAVIALFGWTSLAIQLRPWVLQIKASGFVEYSRAQGLSFKRITFLGILPQTLPFLFANFIFFIPSAILAETGLSFLGLGDPSLPTWGQILQQGFNTGAVYLGYWWWVVPPGIAIVATSTTFFLLFLTMEGVAEPRLRRR